ncbi:hypothetical protein ACV3QH_08575 [Clostridium perfringens]
MNLLRSVKLFYIVYTIYTVMVLSISNYKLVYAVTGLLAMWITYFFFWLGWNWRTEKSYNGSLLKNDSTFFKMDTWKNWKYLLNSIICVTFSILAAKYYTGRDFISVINGALNGGNLYNLYQNYFMNSELGVFSLKKIPYILMLTYITAVLFISYVSIIQINKKIKGIQVFYLCCVTFSQIYFGFARGTNFEIYIVFILLAFTLLNKKSKNQNQKLNYKAIVIVAILGVIMLVIYRAVVMDRGVKIGTYICKEIEFDYDSYIVNAFPIITNVIASVFSYLGYGIYEIGVSFLDNVLSNVLYMMGTLVANGNYLFNGKGLPDMLRSTIDVNVNWVPDFIILIDMFGIILFILFIMLVGHIISNFNENKYPVILVNVVRLLTFIEMLSLPVGNFLITSTPIKLFVLLIILKSVILRFKIKVLIKR